MGAEEAKCDDDWQIGAASSLRMGAMVRRIEVK